MKHYGQSTLKISCQLLNVKNAHSQLMTKFSFQALILALSHDCQQKSCVSFITLWYLKYKNIMAFCLSQSVRIKKKKKAGREFKVKDEFGMENGIQPPSS